MYFFTFILVRLHVCQSSYLFWTKFIIDFELIFRWSKCNSGQCNNHSLFSKSVWKFYCKNYSNFLCRNYHIKIKKRIRKLSVCIAGELSPVVKIMLSSVFRSWFNCRRWKVFWFLNKIIHILINHITSVCVRW